MPVNVREGVVYEEPETIAERRRIAEDCIEKLGIEIPAVIDGMDNAFLKAYNSWPNRVYILGGDGIVHFKGDWGPQGIARVDFETPLEALLALPGEGRFTEHRPALARLAATPVRNADLKWPEGLVPDEPPEGFYAEARRKPGPAFEIDVPATLTRGREILAGLGLPEGGEIREGTLVAVSAEGGESGSKRSRLFRLRYLHFLKNVPLAADRIDLVFDKQGLVRVSGHWHGVREPSEASDAEPQRRSSLDAAREAEMMAATARVVYALRPTEDGPRYVPVYRLVEKIAGGEKVADVDLIR